MQKFKIISNIADRKGVFSSPAVTDVLLCIKMNARLALVGVAL